MTHEKKGKSILVIEDDPKIRSLIKLYLEKDGYDVLEAADGMEGMDAISYHDPCFLIVDLMLPKVDGLTLCKWVRVDQQSEVPIIMVTAKVEEKDRITGLQMGADDYITKPFSPSELVVRVETVLRRTAHRCNKISYRGITLKPLKAEVKSNGENIQLTKHEFKLLYFLMRHPNQIISREQILDEIYPNHEKLVTDRTVDVHIKNLREKIQSNNEREFIETVRGMGYRFVSF
jgi:DNA-binding response OmpR family regulator